MSTQRRMRCEQLLGTQSSDAHPGSLTATPVPEADRTTARALGTCPHPTPSVVLHSPPRDQKLPQCGQGAGPGGHVPYLAGPHLTPRIPPRRTRTQTHTEAGTGEPTGRRSAWKPSSGEQGPHETALTMCPCTSLGGAHGDSSNYDLQSGVSWDFSRN